MKPPRFYLRDLFWLTLAVALSAGWWVSSQRLQMEARRDRVTLAREAARLFDAAHSVSFPGGVDPSYVNPSEGQLEAWKLIHKTLADSSEH